MRQMARTQKQFEWRSANEGQIAELSALGLRPIDIARLYGVSERTLMDRYQANVDEGRSRLVCEVLTLALDKIRKGNVRLILRYLDVYCGHAHALASLQPPTTTVVIRTDDSGDDPQADAEAEGDLGGEEAV